LLSSNSCAPHGTARRNAFREVLIESMSTAPSATAKASRPVAPAATAEFGAGPSGVLHPAPGATATFIGDLRELFKVKVTTMVLVTTWAGFYLGSMHSGITSVQRGLDPLGTLVGVALVSAGASALNEALRAQTDGK
jgi:protoheme IX farnesyltransferase